MSLKEKLLEALDTALALPVYALIGLLVLPMWLAGKLADKLMPEERRKVKP